MALRIGFAQEIITPELGVPLCGYFVPRPNTGAYDDLYVRALVIEGNDGERCAIVSADLCFLSLELIDRCRCAIKNIGIDYHGKIIFSATPTEYIHLTAISIALRTLNTQEAVSIPYNFSAVIAISAKVLNFLSFFRKSKLAMI